MNRGFGHLPMLAWLTSFGAVALVAAAVAAPPKVKKVAAAPLVMAGQSTALSTEQQRLDQLVAALTRSGAKGKSPDMAACLAGSLEIARLMPLVPPAQYKLALRDLQAEWVHHSPLLHSPAMAMVQRLAEQVRAPHGGRAGQVVALSWLGPFGDEHGTALARVAEVEAEAIHRPAAVPQQNWRGRQGPVSWRELARAPHPEPTVMLDELVDRPDDALVYVQSWIKPLRADQAGRVTIRLGVDGPARLWLGGKELGVQGRDSPGIAAKPETYGIDAAVVALPAVDELTAVLRPGWQRLLVKLAPAGASLPLSIRVLDGNGAPLAVESAALPVGASAVAGEEPPLVAAEPDRAAGLRWPEGSPLTGDLAAALLQMAWHGWPMPKALEERLLELDVADLPALPQVAVAHALLPGEAGDRVARLAAWRQRMPADVSLLVAHARALDEAGQTTEAHRQWLQFAEQTGKQAELESVDACRTRVAIWSHMAADRAANGLLLQCLQKWPSVPRLLRDRAHRLAAADEWRAAADLHAQAVRLLDVPESRGEWVTALAESGQLAKAEVEAEKLLQMAPLRTRLWENLARYHLADGELAKAQALLLRVPVAQRRTQWHDLAGQLAQRQGQRSAAIDYLRTAAALSPQRADLRARLQLLAQGSAFYAEARRDLLAMVQRERAQPRLHPLEVRLRQTLMHSLGNGQQARYEAEVWYLGPGAPASHQSEIDYAPSLSEASVLQAVVVRADGKIERQVGQEVDRFTEDASGMYFDLERLTLKFQNLRPGDAVVVEHATHDLAPAPFGLVFGELVALGDVVPVREVQVAIRLPQGMALHAQVRDHAQPDRKFLPDTRIVGRVEEGGPWQQWSWNLGPFAAAANEAQGPGATEQVAYLHASSFGGWPDVVQWYQGLLREALPARGADPLLRDLAARLAQGKPTAEAKVRAVYDYARSQVRYVGLEFGIHSIKPHTAREVAQRQFGDCKDKATLIVALLGELGIDAELALVRTADHGQLSDSIASLGVFNHAIAWVPELGWWLDATATHHGPLELPAGDTGGMALRIRPRGAKVEVLPTADFAGELAQSSAELRLDGHGGAALTWSGQWRGLAAAMARQLLATGSQKEKLESEIAGRWPSLQAAEVQVSGVDPHADAVTAELAGRVTTWGQRQGHGWLLAPVRPQRPWQELLARAETRKSPLVLEAPVHETETVRVLLPAGWRAKSLPGQQKLAWQRCRFELTARPIAGGLEVVHHLEIPQVRISADGYGEFRSWLAQVDAALRAEIAVGPEVLP